MCPTFSLVICGVAGVALGLGIAKVNIANIGIAKVNAAVILLILTAKLWRNEFFLLLE